MFISSSLWYFYRSYCIAVNWQVAIIRIWGCIWLIWLWFFSSSSPVRSQLQTLERIRIWLLSFSDFSKSHSTSSSSASEVPFRPTKQTANKTAFNSCFFGMKISVCACRKAKCHCDMFSLFFCCLLWIPCLIRCLSFHSESADLATKGQFEISNCGSRFTASHKWNHKRNEHLCSWKRWTESNDKFLWNKLPTEEL